MPAAGKDCRIPNDPELVAKELREAGEDLVAAERTLAEGNAKWAIIQGYYAQFHALRALVFSRGYREKSHSCLRYAVEALYVDEGLLPASVLEDFSFAMRTREGADYGCVYSGSDAGDVVASAGAIVDRVRTMLG
ncbi:HEPN domain-containing protein [Methanoculleus oceani]|uniref:HEPN domain-containing protein n=1 Tax=Methanoculleus oceani TaxID=2184756 RepID=A0ABD4TDK6_9EURY|nr:hypothetical protein [Methanoculleus sp. CWC-02]